MPFSYFFFPQPYNRDMCFSFLLMKGMESKLCGFLSSSRPNHRPFLNITSLQISFGLELDIKGEGLSQIHYPNKNIDFLPPTLLSGIDSHIFMFLNAIAILSVYLLVLNLKQKLRSSHGVTYGVK